MSSRLIRTWVALCGIVGLAMLAAATASVSFDLIDGPSNDAIGRVLLIAPPLLPLLDAVLLGSRLLPPAFGIAAVALGTVSIILGVAAPFSATAFSPAIILITAENLWALAAALALVIARRPASAPASGRAMPQAHPLRLRLPPTAGMSDSVDQCSWHPARWLSWPRMNRSVVDTAART